MDEVEDIMGDQCVISSEFNLEFEHKKSYIILPATKLWVAVDAVTRVFLPTVFRFCYTCVKNQQNVVYSVRYEMFPAITTFLFNSVTRSLTSVQKLTSFAPLDLPNQQRLMPMVEAVEDSFSEEIPEKCVTCHVLNEPEGNVRADIIFVHGLHGGLDRTWKQGTWRSNYKKKRLTLSKDSVNEDFSEQPSTLKRTLTHISSTIPRKILKKNDRVQFNSTDEADADLAENHFERYSECWPQDWLPLDCPGVRIIALNYTTDVLWCPIWQKKRNRTNLVERSKEMTEELLKHGVGKRPIVWVGHSKGGLFIKQILLNAHDLYQQNVRHQNLYSQTKGIMFYSVPHKGSSVADLQFPLFRRSIELLEIQRNCDFVLSLHNRFLEIFNDENGNKPEIFSFIDTVYTKMVFMNIEMIDYESADPDIGNKRAVPLNHRDICKPAGRDCFLYLELVQLIHRCLPDVLQIENS